MTPIEEYLVKIYHFGTYRKLPSTPPTRSQAAQGFAGLGGDSIDIQRLLNFPSTQHARQALQSHTDPYSPDPSDHTLPDLENFPVPRDVLRHYSVYTALPILPDWVQTTDTPIVETVLFLLNYWLTPYYLQELTKTLLQFRESRLSDPSKPEDLQPFLNMINPKVKQFIPVLHAMGFTQAQIAQLTNTSQQNVHYHLHKPPRRRKRPEPGRREHRRTQGKVKIDGNSIIFSD